MNRLKDKGKELIDQYRFYIIGGLALFCIVMMVFMFMNLKSSDTSGQSNFNSSHQTTRMQGNFTAHRSDNHRMFVDVEGAVKHPGVYQFTDNMRVDDAINLAGGLNRSADRKHIDLAKKLSDQETVYIPVKGEIKTTPGSSGSGGGHSGNSSQSSNGKININQADQHQLQSIDGIGEKRADKIVDYRKQHGNFGSVDDLKKINGIGDKFLSNIKSHITV